MYVYTLALEWIGHDIDCSLRHIGEKPMRRPWVARLVKRAGRLDRTFVDGKLDYSKANSIGSRGVYVYYDLEPGLYDVLEYPTWGRERRYQFMLDAVGTREEITLAEAKGLLHV